MRARTAPLSRALMASACLWAGPWAGAAGAQADGGRGVMSPLQLRGAVHVHSSFSTGLESLEEVAENALARGVDVLVLADDDLLRVEYGVPFLRNLARVVHGERAAASHAGLEAYLAAIRRIRDRYPELIVIDGVESAPFYWWDRDPDGTWVVRGWNKHMMAIDLRTAAAYEALPVLGSPGIWRWRWPSLALLWPLPGLIYAFWLGRRLHSWLVRGPVAALCLLCLADSAVVGFKVPDMDPYHGDLGAAPYQRFIDYVNGQGGMATWAHPEAASTIPPRSMLGGLVRVVSRTEAHADDLVATRDYIAFAALYADHITATEPGRQWDQVLVEYLAGERHRPVWGTGEIDYHVDEEGGRLHDISTVFLVRQHTRGEVLEALHEGRMYATRGGDRALALSAFTVATEAGTAGSGEEVPAYGRPRISVGVDRWDGSETEVRVRLVRGGASGQVQVVADVTGPTPLDLEHVGSSLARGGRAYYRVLASSHGGLLTSNPIFVSGG